MSDERIVRPQLVSIPSRTHEQKFTALPKYKTNMQAAHECERRLSAQQLRAALPSQLPNPEPLARGPHARPSVQGSPFQLVRDADVQEHQEHPARCSRPVERAPPAKPPAPCARATSQRKVAAQPPPSRCVAARAHCTHPCAPARLPAIRQRGDDLTKSGSPQRRHRARSSNPIRSSDSERLTAPAKSVTVTNPELKVPMPLAER